MKDFWEEEKKINMKKVIAVSAILTILIGSIVTVLVLYNANEDIKNWIDKKILNKEILQDTSTVVELDDENAKVFAFNRNVAILSKNKFKIYNNFGSKESELDLEVTNPLVSSDNRFFAIAEKAGQKVYVIEDKKISWQDELEGEISQIHINKNGYVAVIVTGTSYKSIVAMYDNKGNKLFKKYLSNARLSDVDISNDNKYLALSEVDTSGSIVQSSVRVISIEDAKNDAKNSTEKVYNSEPNNLITNIKYQDNNKLVCMYDTSIHVISDEKDEMISDNTNQKTTFSSIDLENNIVEVQEQASGLFSVDSILNITNIGNNGKKQYIASGATKEITTFDNIIALNLGSEIEFINTDGWLVKKYIAKQEITNTVISNSIAGIVYRDKVEIINL